MFCLFVVFFVLFFSQRHLLEQNMSDMKGKNTLHSLIKSICHCNIPSPQTRHHGHTVRHLLVVFGFFLCVEQEIPTEGPIHLRKHRLALLCPSDLGHLLRWNWLRGWWALQSQAQTGSSNPPAPRTLPLFGLWMRAGCDGLFWFWFFHLWVHLPPFYRTLLRFGCVPASGTPWPQPPT